MKIFAMMYEMMEHFASSGAAGRYWRCFPVLCGTAKAEVRLLSGVAVVIWGA